MTECNREVLTFSSLGRQKIVADFQGGCLTSDAGALLLREVDRRFGLTDALAACMADPRDPAKVTHDLKTLLAQRIYGIALGYEDLNDHHSLREDPLFAVLAEQHHFHEVRYAAETWDRERRVIVKAEYLSQGPNTRFLVTNLSDEPKTIYDGWYAPRGDMENRIKEQQLGLFADRTGCHRFIANQLRLFLASAAYVLIAHLRRLGLKGTELAKAQVTTIRLKLLKVAARVRTSVRRVVLHLSSAYPYQRLFAHLTARLVPT